MAIVALYVHSLNGEWIYDDHADILGNPTVQRLWPLKDHFLQNIYGQTGLHPRPLVKFTFALNFLFGKNDPFVYRLTNLCIHLLGTLTLFRVLSSTLSLIKDRYSSSATHLAFVAALLWGIHPIQAESVAYITQRYESLMGLFVLLTFYCIFQTAQSPHKGRWSLATILSCFFALESKEVAVSLPLLILLYDRTFLAGSFLQAWRSRWKLYLAVCGTWVVFAVNQLLVPGRSFAGYSLPLSWWQYAVNQPNVILHYLGLSIWPQSLVLDYVWLPAPSLSALLPGLLAVGSLLILTIVALFHWPKVGFLGAFFFLILAPTSSILPILDLAVEHRMYLPLAAVLTLLVLGGNTLVSWVTHRWPTRARLIRATSLSLVGVALALLGSLTYLRADDFRNSVTIWLDTVIKRPNNPRARNNYACALHALGQTDEAIAQCKEGLRIDPSNANLRGNLGAFLLSQRKYSEAKLELGLAARAAPADPKPWVNLGLIYARLKQPVDAEVALRNALTIDPTSASAYFELGNLYTYKKDYSSAQKFYQQAIHFKPSFSPAYWARGETLLAEGRGKDALPVFEEYIRMEVPVKAVNLVGRSLLRHGYPKLAFDYWDRNLALKPPPISTLLLSSWTLSTHPEPSVRDGAEALRRAQTAMMLKGKREPAILEALGAAYAELGRFAEACGVTREAIALLEGRPQNDVSSLRRRLQQFEKGEPYREAPNSKEESESTATPKEDAII